jgi:hypothetical protein
MYVCDSEGNAETVPPAGPWPPPPYVSFSLHSSLNIPQFSNIQGVDIIGKRRINKYMHIKNCSIFLL